MTFRLAETEHFPFDRIDHGIWYFTVRNSIIEEFKATITDRTNLIAQLEQFIHAKMDFKLCGVWHGEYRTDIFILNPTIALETLKKDSIKRKRKK